MRLKLGAGVFALALVAAFSFASRGGSEEPPPAPAPEKPFAPPLDAFSVQRAKGVYEFSGTLAVPTPCHSASADASAASSTPERIRVDVRVPRDEGVCLERPSQAAFTASLAASAPAVISVYVNGEYATTVGSAP